MSQYSSGIDILGQALYPKNKRYTCSSQL